MHLIKATVSFEVLLDADDKDSIHGVSLSTIVQECIDGGWSSSPHRITTEDIKGEEACRAACAAQGTDLEFFFH